MKKEYEHFPCLRKRRKEFRIFFAERLVYYNDTENASPCKREKRKKFKNIYTSTVWNVVVDSQRHRKTRTSVARVLHQTRRVIKPKTSFWSNRPTLIDNNNYCYCYRHCFRVSDASSSFRVVLERTISSRRGGHNTAADRGGCTLRPKRFLVFPANTSRTHSFKTPRSHLPGSAAQTVTVTVNDDDTSWCPRRSCVCQFAKTRSKRILRDQSTTKSNAPRGEDEATFGEPPRSPTSPDPHSRSWIMRFFFRFELFVFLKTICKNHERVRKNGITRGGGARRRDGRRRCRRRPVT